MRDLINIIDQVVLLETSRRWGSTRGFKNLPGHKTNKVALEKALSDLFTSLGKIKDGYFGSSQGIPVTVGRKLWKSGKLYYTMVIYTNYYEDVELRAVIAEKLKPSRSRGKRLHRGLSGRIQKVITDHIPNWKFSRYSNAEQVAVPIGPLLIYGSVDNV